MTSLSSSDNHLIYDPLTYRQSNPLSHLTLGFLMTLMTLLLLLGLLLLKPLLLRLTRQILLPLESALRSQPSLVPDTTYLEIRLNLLLEQTCHLQLVLPELVPLSELHHVLLALVDIPPPVSGNPPLAIAPTVLLALFPIRLTW